MQLYQNPLTIDQWDELDIDSLDALLIEDSSTTDIYTLVGNIIRNGRITVKTETGYQTKERGTNYPTINQIQTKFNDYFDEKRFYKGNANT